MAYNNDRGSHADRKPKNVKTLPDGTEYVKHSGSDNGIDKKGSPWVNGWNYSKRDGLVKFFAFPYKDTEEKVSGTGHKWHNWMLQIQRGHNVPEIIPCLYSPETNKVICDKINLVMNPKAKDGGYCGKIN